MSEPRVAGKVLKPWALELYAQFESDGHADNCYCHIAPPCGSCTHEGNPRNIEEDEDAWEWESMTDMLDAMQQEANERLASFIEAHAAHHRAAIAKALGGQA